MQLRHSLETSIAAPLRPSRFTELSRSPTNVTICSYDTDCHTNNCVFVAAMDTGGGVLMARVRIAAVLTGTVSVNVLPL